MKCVDIALLGCGTLTVIFLCLLFWMVLEEKFGLNRR